MKPTRILTGGAIASAMIAALPALAHKLAVLVFMENAAGEHLLLLRAKPPNLGVWSPIGGKLETALGESPFECAVREVAEETGETIATPGALTIVIEPADAVAVFVAASVARAVIAYDGEPACLTGSYVHS